MTQSPKSTSSACLLFCATILVFFFAGGLLRSVLWPLINARSPVFLFILFGGLIVSTGMFLTLGITIANVPKEKRIATARFPLWSSFFILMSLSCYTATVAGVFIFLRISSPIELSEIQWQLQTLSNFSGMLAPILTAESCLLFGLIHPAKKSIE